MPPINFLDGVEEEACGHLMNVDGLGWQSPSHVSAISWSNMRLWRDETRPKVAKPATFDRPGVGGMS